MILREIGSADIKYIEIRIMLTSEILYW